MNTATTPSPPFDLIDSLAGLASGGPTHQVRHHREKVALATEGSYNGLFDPNLPGLTLAERLVVALFACRCRMRTRSADITAHNSPGSRRAAPGRPHLARRAGREHVWKMKRTRACAPCWSSRVH